MKTRMSLASKTPGDRKKFPPEVKTVNMIHVMKRRSKRALRDVCAVEPVTPKFNPWSACPITFDCRDHPTSIRHGGSTALVLDPIINGYHLIRVLMDDSCSLKLIYQDTVRKMGIDPSRISLSDTTFKGVIPGLEARCAGSLVLEVVFGSPDNFRSEKLTFDIAPFRSGYQAYSKEQLSLVLMQYRITLLLSLSCPVHVASS